MEHSICQATCDCVCIFSSVVLMSTFGSTISPFCCPVSPHTVFWCLWFTFYNLLPIINLLLSRLLTAFPFAALRVLHRQRLDRNSHVSLRNQIIQSLCTHHISVGSTPTTVQLGSPLYDPAGEVAALSRRALFSALHSHCATLLQPVCRMCVCAWFATRVCSRLQTCVGFVQTIMLCGFSYVTTGHVYEL
jgi:hypothetical protein